MATPRPVAILIAAMGGEGGGVLTSWIVNAATAAGLPVQSTSIPGVAQRTGATTYYIEILPVPCTQLGGARPVLSLVPSVGAVDLVAASELLEAGRMIAGGFVTPDRTTLVASTHRVFAISEKTAGGDGRFDAGLLFKAAQENARRAILFDMEHVTAEARSAINATLLGAMVASGAMPIPAESFEAAISAEGKAVEGNLRGFRAGLAAAGGEHGSAAAAPAPTAAAGPEALAGRLRTKLPGAAVDLATEGVKRLVAYQDGDYASLYLDRLSRIARAEQAAAGGGQLTREVARHLALRMSYEDVIRVAQLKTDPQRIARIEREATVEAGQPITIVDYFKPGIEEACSIMPPGLARRILAISRRKGWLDRAYLGMHVRTSSLSGFLRLWLLARLRPWRPRSYRFAEEQAAIERWLGRVEAALRLSQPLALEIAECARLIKGYGDTHRRGVTNHERIVTALVDPALAGRMPAEIAADAIANARVAALADPEGDSLDRALTAIQARAPLRAAAE